MNYEHIIDKVISAEVVVYSVDSFDVFCGNFKGKVFRDGRKVAELNAKQLGLFLILAEAAIATPSAIGGQSGSQLGNDLSRLVKDIKRRAGHANGNEAWDARGLSDRIFDRDIANLKLELKNIFSRPGSVGELIVSRAPGYKLAVTPSKIRLADSPRLRAMLNGELVEDGVPASPPAATGERTVNPTETSTAVERHEDRQTWPLTTETVADARNVDDVTDDAFYSWLAAHGRLSGTFLAMILMSGLLSLYWRELGIDSSRDGATLIMSVAHLCWLGIAIVYMLWLDSKTLLPDEALKTADHGKIRYATMLEEPQMLVVAGREAAKDLEGFQMSWTATFVFWFGLYVAIAAFAFRPKDPAQAAKNFDIWFNLLNYLSALALCLCFNVLRNGTSSHKEKAGNRQVLIIGLVAIGALLGAERFMTEIGADGKPFKVVCVLVSGIVLALFIGRFQSKFLQTHIGLLITFYLYSALQPLGLLIGVKNVLDLEYLTPVVLFLAFCLKVLLSLYIFWLIDTGRLLFYLVRVRITKAEANRQWLVFRALLKNQ